MTKQPPQESDTVDYERCPVFRKHFSILVSNPESDDLVLTVHDAKMREKERPRPLGKVKVSKIFVVLKNIFLNFSLLLDDSLRLSSQTCWESQKWRALANPGNSTPDTNLLSQILSLA